jgi:hypothetical protein
VYARRFRQELQEPIAASGNRPHAPVVVPEANWTAGLVDLVDVSRGTAAHERDRGTLRESLRSTFERGRT